MKLELERMEPGRWYALRDLPGFVPDLEVMLLCSGARRTKLVTSSFLLACVRPALHDDTLRGAFLLKPSGVVYADLQQVPHTIGDPPIAVGLDIEVVFSRM